MKTLLKRLLPSGCLAWYRRKKAFLDLYANYLYDARRFTRHSGLLQRTPPQGSLQAAITMGYHAIEKGLSLPEPRPGFGKPAIVQLIEDTKLYESKYGKDNFTDIVVNCLIAYRKFHEGQEHHIDDIQDAIEELLSTCSREEAGANGGGIHVLSREEILNDATIDCERFFRSRHSIRSFSSQEVPLSLIEEAVRLAQMSPSVCNRQSSRVHVVSGAKNIEKCLDLQSGARGFVSHVNKLLICTADLGQMMSVGERNQCWTDGGMYAMSLIYALHSLGLGTCCLNWSKTKKLDTLLRRDLAIADSECVVMLVAVGFLLESFSVAQSPRHAVDKVLTVHR